MSRAQTVLLAVGLALLPAAGCRPAHGDALYQVATVEALLAGAYEGQVTFGQLERRGDFGLGTLDALDGEMVAVDGEFYQIKMDGQAYLVSDRMTTPFAVVTFFDADRTVALKGTYDLAALGAALDAQLPSENVFYAVRIDGKFDQVVVRTVPRQQKPYPPLAEAVRDQVVFTRCRVAGTVVGFRCPPFVGVANVPGYHMHFLNEYRTVGGHVLSLTVTDPVVQIDEIHEWEVTLPHTEGFRLAAHPAPGALEKVEK